MTPSFLIPGLLLAATASLTQAAELRLPNVFSEHAVLQRGRSIPVWGWADPGATVTATLDGASATAKAGPDGRWMLALPARQAGGPFELTVASGDQKRTLADMLIGDVWLCSGQSNMQWRLGEAAHGAEDAAAAAKPGIRLLSVPNVASKEPLDDQKGRWSACTPETAVRFSAVGYHFGRELNQRLNVPIGLVDTSWGGTPAEAWTPRAVLAEHPDLKPIVARWEESLDPQVQADLAKRMAAWEQEVVFEDPGMAEQAKGWAAPDLPADGWKPCRVPTSMEALGAGNINGAVWFRRSVDLPAAWAGRDLVVELGAIDDFDTTWLNGAEIGHTGKDTANWWATRRSYTVPGATVKGGATVIALRVFDRFLGGGLSGPAKAMRILPAGDEASAIPLAGDWSFRIEVMKPEPTTPRPSGAIAAQNAPGYLFNAMIRPLAPYGITGAIWYQGESNAGRAEQYASLLPAMVGSWRDLWAQGDLPFYVVSLANFMDRREDPGQSDWAELRESQDLATRTMRHAGLAVTIDIGEAKDIHPRDKRSVGLRLALQAMRRTYGADVVASGPTLRDVAIDGATVRVRFADLGGGLATSDGKAPRGFALADGDRNWVWATTAAIDGDAVVLRADGVLRPLAVRYGWADNPDVNLTNREGLPAIPFRSDNWPGHTSGNR